MTEREMEDLLWAHSEKLLKLSLKQFERQPIFAEVGRADLVFEDSLGRLLVIEIKKGRLERGAIDQVMDYFGGIKHRYPGRPVEMMVLANAIPIERRLSLEKYEINHQEISEERFRDVASEVGYEFKSELVSLVSELTAPTTHSGQTIDSTTAPIIDFCGRKPGDVLMLRYFTTHGGRVRRGDFLAMIDEIVDDKHAQMSHHYGYGLETSHFHFGPDKDGAIYLFAEAWANAPTIAMEALPDDPQRQFLPPRSLSNEGKSVGDESKRSLEIPSIYQRVKAKFQLWFW
jgi:hypothetical protein